MSIDQNEFKNALSQFASGITVITFTDEKQMGGLTVTGFSSLSLEPPLVLITINKNTPSHDKILSSGGFAVNILGNDQEEISNQFASSKTDKHNLIQNFGYSIQETNSPILKNCLTNLDCRVESEFSGGDHSIVVGKVVWSFVDNTKRPLVYYNRNYYKI